MPCICATVGTHDHPFLYPSASGSKVVGEASSGSLDRGGTARLNFALPVEGITIRLCVSQGYLVLYASVSSTAPNSAVNDFMLEIGTGCSDIYIDPTDTGNGIDNSMGRRKRQMFSSTASESANITLYVSIEGVEERNTFILQTTTGDTSTPGTFTSRNEPYNLLTILMLGYITVPAHKTGLHSLPHMLYVYRSASHEYHCSHNWMWSGWRIGAVAGSVIGHYLGYKESC